MAMQVVNLATLQCTFGAAPSTFLVPPMHRVMAGYQPAANILDHKPFVNILPFGVCTSLAFPATASATAAALGVLTPMPCIPLTAAPWVPGAPTVLVDFMPALNNTSKCICTWGGVISVINPGQTTDIIP